MIALLVSLLLLVLYVPSWAATYTATSCSSTHVQACLDGSSPCSGLTAGDTVQIPAGTCAWSSPVTWTAPANVTIKGAGSLTTIGGGGTTTIIDDYTSNAPLFDITVNASGVFRFAGITIQGGTGAIKDEEGVFRIIGASSTSTVRIDHATFDMHTYTTLSSQHMLTLINVKGVVDHCILNWFANGASYIYRSGPSLVGDEVWAAPTNFGTDDFIFFEDSQINALVVDASSIPSRLWDCNSGGKGVLRFSTLSFSSGGEVHATGHAGNDRSCRAHETYGNHYKRDINQDITGRIQRAFADTQGGTALIWGNNADTDSIQNYGTFSTTRRNTITYPQFPTPTGWGHCGPVSLATGTVSVSGTAVTKTAGTDFDTGWPVGTIIHIADATCEGTAGQEPADGPGCGIASVNSTTSITLANGGHTGGDLTGKTYTTGSAWDGNTDDYGYPCLDQTGRGEGDLLVGSHPTKVNDTTGTIAWPNQALEPLYFWKNSGTPTSGAYSNGSPNLIVADRDYYAQASGIQTSSSSPFNGTTGTGWGTLANRPSTCTTGVGYFATDQGAWNVSMSNPEGVQQSGADGLLYKCTSTNTWSLYYTPYTYPHPLATATPTTKGHHGRGKGHR